MSSFIHFDENNTVGFVATLHDVFKCDLWLLHYIFNKIKTTVYISKGVCVCNEVTLAVFVKYVTYEIN